MKKIRDISNEEMMEIFNDPKKRDIFDGLSFKTGYGFSDRGKHFTGYFDEYCKDTKGELKSHSDYYYLRLDNIGEARFKKDTAEDLGLIDQTDSIGISISTDEELANSSDQEKIEYIKYLENIINTIAKGARDIHSKFASRGPSYKYGERASDQIVNLIQDTIKNN